MSFPGLQCRVARRNRSVSGDFTSLSSGTKCKTSKKAAEEGDNLGSSRSSVTTEESVTWKLISLTSFDILDSSIFRI
jgi:hypothetical protein